MVAKMPVSRKPVVKEEAKKHFRNVSEVLPSPSEKPPVIPKSPEAQRSPSACAKKKAKPKVAFGKTVTQQQRSPSPVENDNKENSIMEATKMSQKLSPSGLKKQTRTRNPAEVQAC